MTTKYKEKFIQGKKGKNDHSSVIENNNTSKYSLEEVVTIKALKVIFFLKQIARMVDFKDTKEKAGGLILRAYQDRKYIAVSSKRLQQVFDNGLNYGFGITIEEVELIMKFAPLLAGLRIDLAPDEKGDEINYYSYIL